MYRRRVTSLLVSTMIPPVDLLAFDNVTLRRGRRAVLKNVTFTLKAGKNLAIIGPNGSGKSTLIKLLTRELYPTEGEVRVFGRSQWHVMELRSQLGIVDSDLQALF